MPTLTTSQQRKQLNLHLEQHYHDGLEQIQIDIGIPQIEQVRRALKLWFAQHGITLEDGGNGAKQSAARRR